MLCRINLIVSLVFTLLAGCKSAADSSEIYLTEQEAIDTALEIAAWSRPEMSGAQVMPYNITAQQLTLDDAVKKIESRNQVATGYDPQRLVWFITMEGVWFDEFPRPADFPTPTPYHHFVVILDAKTGSDIEISASP